MSPSTFGHSMKVKLRQGGRRVRGEPVLSVTENIESIDLEAARIDKSCWLFLFVFLLVQVMQHFFNLSQITEE